MDLQNKKKWSNNEQHRVTMLQSKNEPYKARQVAIIYDQAKRIYNI